MFYSSITSNLLTTMALYRNAPALIDSVREALGSLVFPPNTCAREGDGEKRYLAIYIADMLFRSPKGRFDATWYNRRDYEPTKERLDHLYKLHFSDVLVSTEPIVFLWLFLHDKKTVSINTRQGYVERILGHLGCEITCTNHGMPKYSSFKNHVDFPPGLKGVIDDFPRTIVKEYVDKLFKESTGSYVYPDKEEFCNIVRGFMVDMRLFQHRYLPIHDEQYNIALNYVMDLTKFYFDQYYFSKEDVIGRILQEYVERLKESNPRIFSVDMYPWQTEFVQTSNPGEMKADVYLFVGDLWFDNDCKYDPDFQRKYEDQIRSLIEKVNRTGESLYIVIYGGYDLYGRTNALCDDSCISTEFLVEITTCIQTGQIVFFDDLKNYERDGIDFKCGSVCHIYEVRPM